MIRLRMAMLNGQDRPGKFRRQPAQQRPIRRQTPVRGRHHDNARTIQALTVMSGDGHNATIAPKRRSDHDAREPAEAAPAESARPRPRYST